MESGGLRCGGEDSALLCQRITRCVNKKQGAALVSVLAKASKSSFGAEVRQSERRSAGCRCRDERQRRVRADNAGISAGRALAVSQVGGNSFAPARPPGYYLSAMDNALRKRLEILKNRAKKIRETYLARQRLGFPLEPGPPCPLVEAAPGEEIHIGPLALYLVRTEAESVVDDAPVLAGTFSRDVPVSSWHDMSLRLATRTSLEAATAADFCFFDIETTGLTPSTYVFLCGMMYLSDGAFVIEQAFARDYAEELGMLVYTRRVLDRYPVLVTFNGASFDVPFVKTRLAVGRIDYPGPREHVDLLIPARRRFGGVLANCKLGTIERHLRGERREGDIPGSEIPDAYHDFVRTGDARTIKRIFHHNRLDLVAMAALFDHLVEGHSGEAGGATGNGSSQETPQETA